MAVITADEYEALLNESLADLPDAYVSNIIDSVGNRIAEAYGNPLASQVFTEELYAKIATYRGLEALRLRVRFAPVTSVSSVGVWYTLGDSTALDVEDAMILRDTGVVLVPFGHYGTWRAIFVPGERYRAEITYTAGETEALPVEVKRAVALLVQEQLAADAQVSREDTDDVISYSIAGEYSETRQSYDDRLSWGGLGLGSRNSRIAVDVLDHHFRGTGALLL
jgi:hypothetical protein